MLCDFDYLEYPYFPRKSERGLLIKSLAMNRHESVEGMAKCYNGVVSS